ncbi:MAG: VOC family protein [Gemmatimonadota bacterium]
MPRPMHFEIHAEVPQRAIAFYSGLFGWTFNQWAGQPYWLIKTGETSEPGIDGGLVPRQGASPADGQAVNAFACTIASVVVDEIWSKAIALGGSAALPKMAIPGVGWLAYLKDTEGNIFGIMQNDPAAK